MIASNKLSLTNIRKALVNRMIPVVSINRFKVMANGAIHAVYSVKGGSFCSIFLSVKEILKAKFVATVEASKEVLVNHFGFTATGHKTTGKTCTCPTIASDYCLKVDGKKVCKHMIAYGKQYLGLTNLSQLSAFIAA